MVRIPLPFLPTLWVLYALLALYEGWIIGPSPDSVLPAIAALVFLGASSWLLLRWARLLFPGYRQGPLLAIGLLFLNPFFIAIPRNSLSQALCVLLMAAVILVACKIWLRDGLKAPSVLLLSLLTGMGAAVHPCFLFLLPWMLLPLWAAARKARRALAWTAGAGILAAGVFLALQRVLPALLQIPPSDGTPRSPLHAALQNAAGPMPGGGIPSVLTVLGICLAAFVLLSLRSPFSRQPAAPVRLSFGAGAAMILGASLLGEDPTLLLILSIPLLFFVLSWGGVHLAGRLRRYRRAPNLLAEHPAWWTAAILFLGNGCRYWFQG